MIKRTIEQSILNDFRRKKVIVLLGARQVGKTTLLSMLGNDTVKSLHLNCDDVDDILMLQGKTSTELRAMLSDYKMVFIDEAQRVNNIGMILKIIGDLKLSDTQVIVTGSSSFDLANEINEPATGRLIEYNLYPFSAMELLNVSSQREENRMLPHRLIYGMYPEVVNEPSDARRILSGLANNYLYKDILSYNGLRKPDMLQKLVRALALQIGSEVSYYELSNLLGIDKNTVESYINLLEKCFVVFQLDSFSRNLRNEIKKGKKIYFYDNGIRNAVISNFAPLELRNDVGALWENYLISERVKRNAYSQNYAQIYFWRTHGQSEIDLVEELDGCLSAFEFKWNARSKAKAPKSFIENYAGATFSVVTPENYWDFVSM